jgi:hypothetical protein
MVERFDDLNENSKQLFATPDRGAEPLAISS